MLEIFPLHWPPPLYQAHASLALAVIGISTVKVCELNSPRGSLGKAEAVRCDRVTPAQSVPAGSEIDLESTT